MSKLITEQDIQDLKNDLIDLADVVEEPIVYQMYIGMTAGNQVKGQAAQPNYSPDPNVTSAMIERLTLEQVQVSGGAYELGDVQFTIRRTTKPSYDDRIDYDGARYRPKDMDRLYLKETIWWEILGRKE